VRITFPPQLRSVELGDRASRYSGFDGTSFVGVHHRLWLDHRILDPGVAAARVELNPASHGQTGNDMAL